MRLMVSALAGVMLAAFGLGGASALAKDFDQAALIKPVDKTLTFIFVPKLAHPWYDVVQAGAKAAVDELKTQGITVEVVWDAQPKADIDEHNRRIETDIGRQPDGLAVSCLDPATNTQLLDEAVANGIHLITFDTFCDPKFRFVGHRLDEEDGRAMANYLAEVVGDSGKVGILAGSLTAPNHVARVRGFKDEMATKHPNIQVAFEQPDNDDLETAVTLTENALQANPDLVGIYGANASAPIGAARAIAAADLAGKVHVTGAGDLAETIQLIDDGVIDGIQAQRQWEIGYWSVKYMVALNQNHTVPMDHATGAFLMNKETLGD